MTTNRFLFSVFCLLITVSWFSNLQANAKYSVKYYGKSYALVVGINNYPAPSWQNLDNATKGAKAREEMLYGHGFDVTTLYDQNATKNNILEKMNTIMSSAQKEDRFLFYFAGHGEKQNNKGYLIPHDGSDFNSYLPLSEITNVAKKLPAKHQLYIMDACYAGFIKTQGGASSATPKDPKYLQKVTNSISKRALTAGGKNQKVLDGGGPDGHSQFTGHLLQGVRKGKADGNGDGFITIAEIHNYLLPNATNDYSNPQITSLPTDEDGLFIFASEIGATQTFSANKAVGGKLRAKTKKDIVNPKYKSEKKEYTTTLSAADWFDKGDETDNTSLAIEYYTNAIQLYPDFNAAYYNRAIAYEDLAENDSINSANIFLKAINDYKKVLELDPYDVDCYFNMGALYLELEQFNDALNAFNKALKIDPEDTYSYTYRGDVYLEMNNSNAAFADYNQAISIEPDDGYLYFDRGYAYLNLREYQNAIMDFNKAISLISDEQDFYYARAEAYEATGDTIKADTDFKKADELNEESDDEEY